MTLYLRWAAIPPTPRGLARETQSHTAYKLLEQVLQEAGLPLAPIQKTAEGRPFAPSLPFADFSIAHTDSLAVCALAVGDATIAPRVGVDAEPLSIDRERALRLAARFFAPAERQMVLAAGNEAARVFLEIFTRKEAYAKYCGIGLAHTLHLDTAEPDFCQKQRVQFLQYVREGHLITLCLLADKNTSVFIK